MATGHDMLAGASRPTAAAPPASDLPSDVRDAVRAQHRAIEKILDGIDATLRRAELGGPLATIALQPLAEQTAELCREFREHLAYENRYLLPIIREIDAWGAERARRIEEEHTDQAAAIDELASAVEDGALARSRAFVSRVGELAAALRIDMQHEEREVLSEDLLRDDVVSIGTEAG